LLLHILSSLRKLMGFFSGRVTFSRFRVLGRAPGAFGPEHLERLDRSAIGKQRVASGDGVAAGWTAGDHVLDTAFTLEKNIVDDALQFALRVDTTKLPADLLRAYTQIDLEALAKGNPSGIPSGRQKKEARESARQRLEEEAKDGRFLKRKIFPVLWDARSNELLFGASSAAMFDRLRLLFEHSFGQRLEPLTAGPLAFALAEPHKQTRGVDDAQPSGFVPGPAPAAVAWLPDEASRDFLGNEYLLWLWFTLEIDDDTLKLSDGSEAAMMLARTLMLECPRGQTGRETITSDGPTRLPEARRAVQSGKWPRKAGLTLVRQDQQYDLTLNAETLSVLAAKLPAPEAVEDRGRLEERIGQLRHLLETLDLVYEAFGRKRVSEVWVKELTRMKKWLRQDDAAQRTALGS
jgi:hypothetical protein